MPQPKVHNKGILYLGRAALQQSPESALLIAEVIVRWSVIETQIAMLFATMLPGETWAAHDIYYEFFDQNLRQKVFLGLAKKKLSPSLLTRTENFFISVRKTASNRNLVAHSVWCYSEGVPGSLCTIEQKSLTKDFISRMQEVRAGAAS